MAKVYRWRPEGSDYEFVSSSDPMDDVIYINHRIHGESRAIKASHLMQLAAAVVWARQAMAYQHFCPDGWRRTLGTPLFAPDDVYSALRELAGESEGQG